MIQKTKPATVIDQVEDFRSERVRLIKDSLQPVSLSEGAKIVLHLVPASAFEQTIFDLASKRAEGDDLKPIAVGGWGPLRFNFDGMIMVSEARESTESYVQVFHNGIVEAVNANYLRRWDEKNFIPATGLENALIEATSNYVKFQRSLGVTPPLFVMLSLLGVKRFRLIANENYGYADGREIDREDLLIPAVEQKSLDIQTEKLLQPIFDRMWNAAGFARSVNYDDSGERKHK